MSEQAQFAIVDLENTTDRPLDVNLIVDGQPRLIVRLAPGESTRQVTPSGAVWSFGSPSDEPDEQTEGDGSGSEVDTEEGGGAKSGGRGTHFH